MVGQGVLRHLLQDAQITSVCSIGRSLVAMSHPKLEQVRHADLSKYASIQARFARFDAVFFCLGVSAFRMQEHSYRAINYDTALGAARALHAANAAAPFIYVSAAGADITMQSKLMWKRVRGEIEHELIKLSPACYSFRPAMIIPLHGIVSRTWSYRVLYAVCTPILPLLRRLMPAAVTTTDELAQGMVHVARYGHQTPIVEASAFARLGGMNAKVHATDAGKPAHR